MFLQYSYMNNNFDGKAIVPMLTELSSVRAEFLSILIPGSFAAEYATCVVKKVGDCREGTISQQMKFNALPDNLDPIIAQFLAQGIAKLIQNVINCI